jgi:PIN domain nuclease of toxin-antitoxin system
MEILVDTNALLWFVANDSRLSAVASQVLSDPAKQRMISVASLWEVTIKFSLNKLPLALPLADFFNQHLWPTKVRLLPIETAHLLKLASLPQHHRDPFDRLIVAQALEEKLPLVSSDAMLDAYGIQRLW